MRKRRSLRRARTGTRSVRKIFIIGVEGETEKLYFDQFKGVSPVIRILTTRGGTRADPDSVVEKVERQLEQLRDEETLRSADAAWVVIDRDTWDPEALKRVYEWTAQHKNRWVAISNPQFELWLLLHYEEGYGVVTQKECLERLGRHVGEYRKNDRRSLPLSAEARALAVERATKRFPTLPRTYPELTTLQPPYTGVHVLVTQLEDAIRESSASAHGAG